MIMTTSAAVTTFLVFTTSLLHHSFGFWKKSWFVETSLSGLISTLFLWHGIISTAAAAAVVTKVTTTDQSRIVLASLPWWRSLSHLLASSWPMILVFTRTVSSKQQLANHVLVQGGPLGPHSAKLCDIAAGLLLWNVAARLGTRQHKSYRNKFAPTFCSFQKPKISVTMMTALVIFTGIVNGVMQLWSSQTKSQGTHKNLQAMVHQQNVNTNTSNNNHNNHNHNRGGLSMYEKAVWLVWAFVNAVCEEVSSRGLWRSAFAMALQQQQQQAVKNNNNNNNITESQVLLWSNLLQALVFGLWHYEGVPSGWTGVFLTTVYGGILGWLADQSGGSLWLPILTHTMADYYIFTIIVQPKS